MTAAHEDPKRTQLKMLEKHLSLKGKDVLEVGCRNGRLTFHYADSARSVKALEGWRVLRRKGTCWSTFSLLSISLFARPDPREPKILGAKWSLIIIRDVAFLKLHRFGEIRRNSLGLTARVLSRRLRQLVSEGILERRVRSGVVTYSLTRKGEDAVYVLLALLRYGIRSA